MCHSRALLLSYEKSKWDTGRHHEVPEAILPVYSTLTKLQLISRREIPKDIGNENIAYKRTERSE